MKVEDSSFLLLNFSTNGVSFELVTVFALQKMFLFLKFSTISVKIVETLLSFRGYFKLGSNTPRDIVVLFSVS